MHVALARCTHWTVRQGSFFGIVLVNYGRAKLHSYSFNVAINDGSIKLHRFVTDVTDAIHWRLFSDLDSLSLRSRHDQEGAAVFY
jgi:hypothetical protein